MSSKQKNFNPLVSIIIPVYNGEKYVSEAIDSALAQTYDNIEIIVVNDGSKDDTEKVCLSYGDKIRYFSKENGGTSTALNVGIRNMKGEYFSWLSHDDTYYPDKIKRQIEELSKLKDKNTIMMTDLDGIDENYDKIYETHYINHINAYPNRKKSMLHPIIYNQTHGCTLLFPKKCFDVVGLFDEESLVAQDFEFFYRAFSKFPHKLIPEILVTARDSSNRQGRRSKVRGSVEYSDLFIKMIQNFSEDEFNDLAPSKLEFYEDMLEFFDAAGYDKAYDFISDKLIRNLQISSYDLIGNKFNGHDLKKYLREQGVSSKELVWFKQSDDSNTFGYDFNAKNATGELLKNKLFYESDIIHFHLIHEYFDLSWLPIMTKLKPCVITLHDPYFLGGHCVHHFDCQKWKNQCYDCEYLDEFYPLSKDCSSLKQYIKKEAFQNSNISVIVASDWIKNQVEQSPVFKGKKIYKIPFGIDLEKFKPCKDVKSLRKELNIAVDDIVIMFRSNDGSFKGLDVIKKALDKIKGKKNITIITTDQKNLLKDYEEDSAFTIKEYGWINDDEQLIKLYQACDIFLMPSKQETFGMMAIEAMACGKFVLSINSAGSALSETICSPSVGLCVEEDEFSNTLEKIINNKKELISKGEICRQFVEQNYSKEKYISSIIEVYKEVIKEHSNMSETTLILNQLRKNNVNSELEYSYTKIENIEPDVHKITLKRKIYRGLPLNFRKKIKYNIQHKDSKLNSYLRKKIVFDE